MARYSLYAENTETGERQLIKVKERENNGVELYKEKVNLSTIDRSTLNYRNDEELASTLYNAGIIPFTDARFYIEYISKKQPVQLPVAYSDLEVLKYFTTNAPIKVSIIDPKYTSLINSYLKDCLTPEFLRFQTDNTYLHEYNAEYIKEYVKSIKEEACPRTIDRQRSLIYTLFNRYKRIRGIIVGSKEYYESIINNEEEIEIVDDCEDLDSIYFGSGYPGDRLSKQKRIEQNG